MEEAFMQLLKTVTGRMASRQNSNIQGLSKVFFCYLCKESGVYYRTVNLLFLNATPFDRYLGETYVLCVDCYKETERILEEMKLKPVEELPLYMGFGSKNIFVMDYIARELRKMDDEKQ